MWLIVALLGFVRQFQRRDLSVVLPPPLGHEFTFGRRAPQAPGSRTPSAARCRSPASPRRSAGAAPRPSPAPQPRWIAPAPPWRQRPGLLLPLLPLLRGHCARARYYCRRCPSRGPSGAHPSKCSVRSPGPREGGTRSAPPPAAWYQGMSSAAANRRRRPPLRPRSGRPHLRWGSASVDLAVRASRPPPPRPPPPPGPGGSALARQHRPRLRQRHEALQARTLGHHFGRLPRQPPDCVILPPDLISLLSLTSSARAVLDQLAVPLPQEAVPLGEVRDPRVEARDLRVL